MSNIWMKSKHYEWGYVLALDIRRWNHLLCELYSQPSSTKAGQSQGCMFEPSWGYASTGPLEQLSIMTNEWNGLRKLLQIQQKKHALQPSLEGNYWNDDLRKVYLQYTSSTTKCSLQSWLGSRICDLSSGRQAYEIVPPFVGIFCIGITVQ